MKKIYREKMKKNINNEIKKKNSILSETLTAFLLQLIILVNMQ